MKQIDKIWIKIVRILIAILEADLRGRALVWLYTCIEESETIQHGRYGRSTGRFHRGPR